MTHTPGPWTASWSKHHEGTFVVKAGMPSNRVLASFDGDGDGPDDQSIADARLIAAAPDLLEAVKQAHEQMLHLYGKVGLTNLLRDVIAKAEGRP